MRTINGDTPWAVMRKNRFEPPTALRSGFSDARSDVTFCFQTIQSGIDGAIDTSRFVRPSISRRTVTP